MKKTIIISTILCCCKPYDQATKSLATGDDEVKIAINYLGDNCTDPAVKTRHVNMSDHKLDGPNGELAVEEFKKVKNDNNLALSGDKFLSNNSINRSIDDIEANCRRLILSVDADSSPTITIEKGKIPEKQADKFNKDFSEFKDFSCPDEFCTSSNIQNGKRYFAYIEPSNDDNFKAQLSYTYSGVGKNNISITLNDVKPRTNSGDIVNRCFRPLAIRRPTINALKVSGASMYGNCQQILSINLNSRDYLQSNNVRCRKGDKGVVILIGNSERVASNCAGDRVISLAVSNNDLQINSYRDQRADTPTETLTFNESGNFDDN